MRVDPPLSLRPDRPHIFFPQRIALFPRCVRHLLSLCSNSSHLCLFRLLVSLLVIFFFALLSSRSTCTPPFQSGNGGPVTLSDVIVIIGSCRARDCVVSTFSPFLSTSPALSCVRRAIVFCFFLLSTRTKGHSSLTTWCAKLSRFHFFIYIFLAIERSYHRVSLCACARSDSSNSSSVPPPPGRLYIITITQHGHH